MHVFLPTIYPLFCLGFLGFLGLGFLRFLGLGLGLLGLVF